MDSFYFFRVRALNSYGWGLYSSDSSVVSLASLTVVAEPQSVGVIMGTISLAIFALAIIGSIFIYGNFKKLTIFLTLIPISCEYSFPLSISINVIL